jgi:hypothetical protein
LNKIARRAKRRKEKLQFFQPSRIGGETDWIGTIIAVRGCPKCPAGKGFFNFRSMVLILQMRKNSIPVIKGFRGKNRREISVGIADQEEV